VLFWCTGAIWMDAIMSFFNSSWLNFGCPREGVCIGAKFFGSASLQPARSVCVSFESFFHCHLNKIWKSILSQVEGCSGERMWHTFNCWAIPTCWCHHSPWMGRGSRPVEIFPLFMIGYLAKFSIFVSGSAFSNLRRWRNKSVILFCRVVRLPCNHYESVILLLPRADSGVVRMDPLRFLAGCRTRRLNQV